MSSIQKRRFICSCFYQKLASYGFFQRSGTVWKYSPKGQYVIKLSCELSRIGTITEIYVAFGSYYSPIEINDAVSTKDMILPNQFDLAYYIRNQGLGFPLLDIHLSVEEQIESIMPHFNQFVFPLLAIGDSLTEYLHMAEALLDMRIASFHGFPRGIDVDEIIYAYISLNQFEEAIRLLMKYSLHYEYAEKYIQHHLDLFYKPAEEIEEWKTKKIDALRRKEKIEAGNIQCIRHEIEQRKKKSQMVCASFFSRFR